MKNKITIILIAASALAVAKDSRDFRYDNVVGQTSFFTCGPAAVSTLLTYYYGIKDASEQSILSRSLVNMGLKEGDEPKSGINMLALKQSMNQFNVPSKGYKMSEEQLKQHLSAGGQPVVVHTTKPQKHFVLAVGMVENDILLADPSWGNRTIPLDRLDEEKGFSGIVLVPQPTQELANKATLMQQNMLKQALAKKNQLKKLK